MKVPCILFSLDGTPFVPTGFLSLKVEVDTWLVQVN